MAGDSRSAFRVERGCPGRFPVHVVDLEGLPHPELTVYANKAGESLARRSVPVYLGEVLRVFSWTARDEIFSAEGIGLMGGIDEVRRVIRDYLAADCKCVLRQRRDSNVIK